MFIALLVIFLSMSTVSAQNIQCDPTQKLMEMSMCLQSHPNIMQIMSQLDSDPQTALESLCNNQPIVVEILECAMKMAITCLPKETNFTDFIPAKENWKNGFEFMCKHKAEPIGSCMKIISDGLPKCMMKNNEELFMPGAAQNMTSQVICRILDTMKPCLQSFKDSCSESTLSTISQTFEKFIPMDKCKVSDSGSAAFFQSFSQMGCYGLGLIALGIFYPFF